MKVVTVLDFRKGEVHVYQYDEMELHNKYKGDIELFIRKKHDHSEYHYMCTDQLILQTHHSDE